MQRCRARTQRQREAERGTIMSLGPPGVSASDEREDSDRSFRSRVKSNRVRFNSKVHVSPTPPNSDASSSDFRRFYSIEQNHQLDGPQDSSHDPPQRGRLRNNFLSQGSQPSQVQNDGEHLLSAEASIISSSAGQSSGAHAWVQGGRRLKRALSESPSREDLIADSRCQSGHDPRGPYRPLEKPTDSMEPQNGSVVSWKNESAANIAGTSEGAKSDQWW